LFFTSILIVAFGGWFNFVLSDPRKGEDYSTPSYLSSFIQTHLSAAYSPPDEVFAERYSGYGEGIHSLHPRAILGPDCAKLLVYPDGERALITTPPKCFKDISILREIVNSIAKDRPNLQPFYFSLTKEQSINSSIHIQPGKYTLGSSGNGNFILSKGWSGLEDFGVWSDGPRAQLRLPCTKNDFYFSRELLSLKILVRPFGSQEIVIQHGGAVAYQGNVSSDLSLIVGLHPHECKKSTIDVNIQIENPRSPLELELSGDSRKLGIALLEFELQ
jgi:hypothetical protein